MVLEKLSAVKTTGKYVNSYVLDMKLDFHNVYADCSCPSVVWKVTRKYFVLWEQYHFLISSFQWLNPSDVDEETKEKIKCQVQKSSIEIVQCNELLTEQLSQKKTIRSMGMPQGSVIIYFLIYC